MSLSYYNVMRIRFQYKINIILFAMLSAAIIFHVANAVAVLWTTPLPNVISTINTEAGWENSCKKKFQADRYEIPLRATSDTKTQCLIGTYDNVKLLGYNSLHNLAIQFPGDKAAYPVSTSCLSSCVYLPSKDIFMTVETTNDVRSGRVAIYKDFIKKLRLRNASLPSQSYYSLDQLGADKYINDFYGTSGYMGAYIKHMQRSPNDKWLVVEFTGAGLFRIDIEDIENMKMLKFSDWKTDYTFGNIPTIEIDITNDGQHVAVLGSNTPISIFDLQPNCGNQLPVDVSGNSLFQQQQTPCPAVSLNKINDSQGGNLFIPHLNRAYQPKFSEDSGEITFYAMSYDNIPVRQVALRAANYTPTQLSYLALGDSYSSGEGDTEKTNGNKYYRPYTDMSKDTTVGQPEERCHISTRSYPYKLALSMELSLDDPKQWNSVACSGAQTIDITPDDRATDRGQGNRLLDLTNYADLKSQALNELIPGRVKQIDFVKKYKPKAITLTIGGNDVGFADKMLACVTSPTTCDYARENYRAKMRSEIQASFNGLASLYRDLATQGDSGAKVYVLSYPQFITDNPEAICNNTFWLDVNERTMIVESVNYINSIIKAAAKKAGVYYVDISNSLGSHKLCDSSKDAHVTAITGLGGINGNQTQESFHPNAQGHTDIAKTVREDALNNTSLLDFDTCPNIDQNTCADPWSTLESVPVPPYFQSEGEFVNVKYAKVTIGDPVAGAALAISMKQFFFAPGQPVTVTLFSNPTPLGTINAGADGSLQSNVTIPATIPPGYHRLTIEGKSYSGEPVEYEQVLLVKSADPADADGDGVVDTADKCLFVQPVGIDSDSDGVDDACDPEIIAPKDPYRIRAGNPEKTYAGQAEKPQYLYIERNIHAAALTGISDDYDSDSDGWVIVAASQNATEAGPYARFWTDGNDGNKIPHVALRTEERGCVQYKPADLSRVTEANNATARTFAQEAEDTTTCRNDPATADLDGDGNADNKQPLYLTRKGDTSRGEDPAKLYLFRSTRAAEAQLGKSDYAAREQGASTEVSASDTRDYRQAWSLLASAPYPAYMTSGSAKLKFIDNSPYVLVGTTGAYYSSCSAYKPESLNTIRRTTQLTRPLQLDLWQTLLLQWQSGCN